MVRLQIRIQIPSISRAAQIAVALLVMLPRVDCLASDFIDSRRSQETQRQGDVIVLQDKEEQRLAIKRGEEHQIALDLLAGEYVKLLISQQGIDLSVAVYGPDGKLRGKAPPIPGPVGDRSVSVFADLAGRYLVKAKPSDDLSIQGAYSIKIELKRGIASIDRKYLAAETKSSEAEQLQARGSRSSREAAIAKYNETLSLWREIGEKRQEADTLHNIGRVYRSLRDHPKTAEHFLLAIAIRREIGDRQGEAYALNELALAYRDQNKSEEAVDAYHRARDLFRESGNALGQASSLYGAGFLYALKFEMRKALEYYDQALKIRREEKDRLAESRTLNSIGGAYDELGEPDLALQYYELARAGWREIGDRSQEANTINNIGVLYYDWGQWQKAYDYYKEALGIYRTIASRDAGPRSREASTLDNLGYLYIALGNYRQAQEHFVQSLQIRLETNDIRGEGETRCRIGYSHYLMEDFKNALESFEQAIVIQEKVSDPRISETRTLAGQVYMTLNRYDEAKKYIEDALKYQQGNDSVSRSRQAITHDKAGQLYALLHDEPRAFDEYNKALAIWRETRNRDGEALTLYNIAKAERARGNLAAADVQIQAALDAIDSLRTNVIGPHLRTSYFSTKVSFYELAIAVKMELHRLAPWLGYDVAALKIAERARARTLLESLTEARMDFRHEVDSKLLQSEQNLQGRIASKTQALIRLLSDRQADARASELEKEINSLNVEFQHIQSEIRKVSPRYAALNQPQPLTLEDIQTRFLDEDTMLLEYSLGDDRSYLWAATTTSLLSVDLPARSVIQGTAKKLYDLLKQPPLAADSRLQQAARQLSEMILGGVSGRLKGKRLLIVADGALQYIPFSVLPIPSRTEFTPLIIEHEIVNLPSATTLAVMRREMGNRQPAPKQIAVLADPVFDDQDERLKHARGKLFARKQISTKSIASAQRIENKENHSGSKSSPSSKRLQPSLKISAFRDLEIFGGDRGIPDLPLSGQEAKGILKLVPPGEWLLATGFQANLKTAQSPELSQYRVVHFATHGILNDGRPELSGLLLSMVDEQGNSQDGFLGLNSVYNLKLSADLVVLSACQTGLGKDVKGEGLIGLTRGFMYAGAPRVIASLWKVRDSATRDLMILFYKKLLVEKKPAAAALKAAQVEMMKKKSTHSPFYWGAFVIQGEWK